jgi:hypothetical protein
MLNNPGSCWSRTRGKEQERFGEVVKMLGTETTAPLHDSGAQFFQKFGRRWTVQGASGQSEIPATARMVDRGNGTGV